MQQDTNSPNHIRQLWKFLASLQLTVFLLLALAATSIVGTLIPQNESPSAYFETFGGFLYRLFSVLDIFDMYHSWWFQLLILLLAINVLVCSLDRLPAVWKIVFIKEPPFNIDRFRKMPSKEVFTTAIPFDQLSQQIEAFASKKFSYHRRQPVKNGVCFLAEKGRWSRLGVYIVHLSVILLLCGGLIGSLFGFEGFANIAEGETVQTIRLRNSGEVKELPFGIRCNDFFVSFYETGAPKEFRSDLTLLEDGQEVVRKNIIVNDPLRYKGINMFQSSYGSLPPEKVTLSFTSTFSGMVYDQEVKIGQVVDLPEEMGTFALIRFLPSADFRGQRIGEALYGQITKPTGEKIDILLPLKFPAFDKMRKGQVSVAISNQEERYYTGLQITKDPGVWVVYAGFTLMILGCFVTFFLTHQRLCIELRRDGKKQRVMLAGTSNRNKIGMQYKVKKLAQHLSAKTEGDAGDKSKRTEE
jgi:cytochrome c biogenesis protein